MHSAAALKLTRNFLNSPCPPLHEVRNAPLKLCISRLKITSFKLPCGTSRQDRRRAAERQESCRYPTCLTFQLCTGPRPASTQQSHGNARLVGIV